MSKLSKNLGLLLGGLIGATISLVFSKPNSLGENRLPELKVKNVEILPNVKIKRKKEIYHIHHWMTFSVFYATLMFIRRPFAGKKFINGFVLGLIFQGFSYKDRFQVKNSSKKVTK